MRILIADSDEAFLEILQSYLWDRGHETEIAVNGLECLAVLREFAPDVLVLGDKLLWGGSNGVMALMSEDPEYALTPVILIGDEHPLPLALRSRVVERLRKPLRLGDLLACIEATRRRPERDDEPNRWTEGRECDSFAPGQ